MMLVLALLCGMQFGEVKLFHESLMVVIDGDSNTDLWDTIQQSWPDQTLAHPGMIESFYFDMTQPVGGKEVYTMIANAPTLIDPKFRAGGICIMLGGYNDIGHGHADQDSTYRLIREFCLARQAVGWYMICMTYPNGGLSVTNDSIRANWATFADEMIDLGADPLIGETADHYNPVYFYDPVHMSVTGIGIIADSVYARLWALR